MLSLRSGFRQLIQTALFWWVKVPENLHHADLDLIKKNPLTVFVLEHQSTADALVVDHELKRLGLNGLYQKLILNDVEEEKSVLTIHARPTVFQRTKESISPRVQRLLAFISNHPDQDILLVPVALYWGRADIRKNSILKALFSANWSVVGPFKKLLTILFNGRDTYVEINKPISLRSLVDDNPDLTRTAVKVVRLLKIHFGRVRTAVIGPDLSHKRVIIDQLLTTEAVRNAIAQYSRTKNVPIDEARWEARKHAITIAADVSYSTIRILDILLSKLWNKIYNGIVLQGIEPVRELAKDNEIVYVPCHRSHIDYLLLSHTLYRHGLNVPHIAAGDNLNMPIIGGILRRGGAFFIRRRFGGDKLYTTIFNEYLHTVFSQGYPVEYFIEGGRSRTGRMRNPATGTLSMTVQSHLRNANKPIVFIPIYIGYEKVFESRSYLGELRGLDKKKESLFDVVKSVKRLKNYGHVYLNFGEPLPLNDQLQQQQPNWNSTLYGTRDRPAWMSGFVDQLSTDILARINSAAALNPVNLLAMVLLATPRQAIENKQLINHLNLLYSLQKHTPYSDYISFPDGHAEDWIAYSIKMGVLSVIPQKLGNLYGTNRQNTILLSYYRNNILHMFALPSLISALIVRANGVSTNTIKERLSMIYPFVRKELFLQISTEGARAQVDTVLNYLVENKLIVVDEHRHYHGPDKTTDQSAQLQFLANIMLPTLERYLITLSVLVRLGSGQCSQTILENQSQQMAQRLSLLNGLDAPEFFDKSLFKTFIQTMKLKKVLTVNSEGNLEFDERIQTVIGLAESVLPNDVWYSIYQVTRRSHHQNNA